MSALDAAAVPVPHVAPPPAEASAGGLPAEAAAPLPADLPPPVPRLLEAIPEGMVDGSMLPLTYRLAAPLPYDPMAHLQRVGADPEHGSSRQAFTPFHKPVSRCVGGRR
jgi:hypothetical protein